MAVLRSIYNSTKKRKWLIISWLALFGTLALLSLTIGNTIGHTYKGEIMSRGGEANYIRSFNRFLWSPYIREGLLPWDSISPFDPYYVRGWLYLIGSLAWWTLLSSVIVIAGNYLLKKINIGKMKLYGKATILLYSAILISVSVFMTALSIHNFQPKIDGTLANYVDSSAIVPVYIWLLYESPENRPEEIDMDADIQQITIVIETLGGNALETNNDDWTFATIRAEIPGTKLRELAKIEQITHIRLD